MRIQRWVFKRARQTLGASMPALAPALVVTLAIALAGAATGCSSTPTMETLVFGKKVAAAREARRQADARKAAAAPTPAAVQDSTAGLASPTITQTPTQVGGTAPAVVPETPGPQIESVPGANVDQVVASVDGEPITQREVLEFASATGNPIPPDDFATNPIARKAIKALISQRLLESEVKKYEDKVDDAQIEKYIEQVRSDKHMSDAEFRAQLQASGMSYEELRKRARSELQKAMMVNQQVREKIQISNADIQVYYDAHKADFTVQKERLKLAQILIALPPNPTQ